MSSDLNALFTQRMLIVFVYEFISQNMFKYNQLAVYSSARTAFSFAWPVLSSRMCLFKFSLLAQHSQASRCCLVLLAQGSPEHLFCSFRFGYLPTNLCLTKQWHKAKRPHTTTSRMESQLSNQPSSLRTSKPSSQSAYSALTPGRLPQQTW